jgi:hypothetical protein
MYKGYTLPEYRGNRLHAVGMARALIASVSDLTTREGAIRGMISYVDSHNFASLTSCERLGYTVVGTMYVLGLTQRPLIWATGRCADYGLRLSVTDEAERIEHVSAELPI